jgi:5'-3' exonuclease
VYFVLEGHPKARYELYEKYKANRIQEPGTEQHRKMIDFHRQKDLIVDLLRKHFPVAVIQQPDYECDDVVFNLISFASRAIDFTVVSNDSDFIQLLQEFENVHIYNPMKKEFVEAPEYDYLTWKALRGDGSDNISGIPGVGDKTAEGLVESHDKLEKFLKGDAERANVFLRNMQLITFQRWDESDMMKMTCSQPSRNWDEVKRVMGEEWGFNSIVNDKAWKKFVDTFDRLWVTR